MSTVLVVHPDPAVAWDRAAALELAGYAVETCGGPSDTACPVVDGQVCPLLDRADALIYDAGLGSTQDMRFLVARLRDAYADLPLIVLGGTDTADALGPDGPRVWRVPSVETVAELAAVVEDALSEQGMAV